MAVAIDATGTETLSTSSASPHTYTGLTTGASLTNGAVVVVVVYDTHVTGSAATWDGVAMTLVASGNNTGTFGRVEIWGLAPITGHTGNKTFSVSWTGGGNAQTMIVGTSWTGVNQTGGTTSFPHGTSNTGTTTGTGNTTVTVTSANGNAVLAGHAIDNDNMSSTNNTQIFVDNGGTNIDGAANRAAGAATVAMTTSFTGTNTKNWIAVGTDILAAGGGPTIIPTPTRLLMGVGI